MPLYITINNTRLYYEDHGYGEPLLLLTGLGGSVTYWSKVIATLSQHYRVITFDHRGSGRSNVEKANYNMSDLVSDVLSLLNFFGITQVNLIGHSLGGMVAQQFAYQYPERINKLIIYASSCKVGFLMRQVLRAAIAIKKVSRFSLIQDELSAGFIQNARISMNFNSRSWIWQLTSPTLVIACAKDPVFPKKHGIYLNNRLRESELVIVPKATHCLHRQNPQVLAQHILSFL